MKITKMALLAGSAIAVTAAAAHADELQDLKAQVEALNARMAAMEAAPAVPQGYQLLAVSKGEPIVIPGLGDSDRDRVVNDRATIISVMPTADAPAGTTISWSGYVRAAIVYNGQSGDGKLKRSYNDGTATTKYDAVKASYDADDDWDVKARGQFQVVATTDTAVGEVGVKIKLRGNFDGNSQANVTMKEAWGYWALTPELTLGGGYSGSLGNIGYGYDGACTCYYTDNADVGFDPGDTTQLRLSYASGPFSMAIAVEDASVGKYSANQLGAAGEIKYSGDTFSGEISGVWRQVDDESYDRKGTVFDDGFNDVGGNIYGETGLAYTFNANLDDLWQVGAGVGFSLGDIASLSLAGAFGSGPFQIVNSSGGIEEQLPINNNWWGVSGLGSANLSDSVHAELGVGYKSREADNFNGLSVNYAEDETGPLWRYSGVEQDVFAILGGAYYTPVDQLTIGLEAEWYQTETNGKRTGIGGTPRDGYAGNFDTNVDNWTVDLVSVWRF